MRNFKRKSVVRSDSRFRKFSQVSCGASIKGKNGGKETSSGIGAEV
jgi:hypothetical protein